MVSTPELGRMFKDGYTHGTASRTQIINGVNFTYLVDYGHAVLAMRNKKSGRITYFSGWDKYSVTTSKHISQLGLRVVHHIVKERRSTSDGLR